MGNKNCLLYFYVCLCAMSSMRKRDCISSSSIAKKRNFNKKISFFMNGSFCSRFSVLIKMNLICFFIFITRKKGIKWNYFWLVCRYHKRILKVVKWILYNFFLNEFLGWMNFNLNNRFTFFVFLIFHLTRFFLFMR